MAQSEYEIELFVGVCHGGPAHRQVMADRLPRVALCEAPTMSRMPVGIEPVEPLVIKLLGHYVHEQMTSGSHYWRWEAAT